MASTPFRITIGAALLVGALATVTACSKSEGPPPSGAPATAPAQGEMAADVTPPVAEPGTELVTLSVTGMHCDACAQTIRDRLVKMNGIRKARVSFPAKTAWVIVEPGGPTAEQLVGGVVEAGYQATATSSGATQPAAANEPPKD